MAEPPKLCPECRLYNAAVDRRCFSCGHIFNKPNAAPLTVSAIQQGVPMSDTKQCPFCAETIKSAATVCRFCNRELKPGVAAAVANANQGKPTNALNKPINANGCIGAFAVLGVLWWFGSSIMSGVNEASRSGDTSGSVPSVSVPAIPEVPTVPVSNNVDLEPHKVKALAEGKYGQSVLAGEVVNTSGKSLRYLEASAEFVDKKGNTVATGMDNSADTLLPGQTWRFEVSWPQGASNAKGKIVSVKGTFQ